VTSKTLRRPFGDGSWECESFLCSDSSFGKSVTTETKVRERVRKYIDAESGCSGWGEEAWVFFVCDSEVVEQVVSMYFSLRVGDAKGVREWNQVAQLVQVPAQGAADHSAGLVQDAGDKRQSAQSRRSKLLQQRLLLCLSDRRDWRSWRRWGNGRS
jgi:hypothetical protein